MKIKTSQSYHVILRVLQVCTYTCHQYGDAHRGTERTCLRLVWRLRLVVRSFDSLVLWLGEHAGLNFYGDIK